MHFTKARTENVEQHEVGEPREAGSAADADLVASERKRQVPVRQRIVVHPHKVGDGAERAQNHLRAKKGEGQGRNKERMGEDKKMKR